jgi:hypothetical protein
MWERSCKRGEAVIKGNETDKMTEAVRRDWKRVRGER